MLTRSILAIMFELATQIDVPPEHAAEGQVIPVGPENRTGLSLRVQTSPTRPDDAFVSVQYEDHRFSIGRKDLIAKRTFTFLNLPLSFHS